MAISIKQYAQALYQAAADKKRSEVVVLIDSTLQLLREKNLLSHATELITEIEKLDNETHGRLQATVRSTEKIDETVLRRLEKMVAERTGAKEIIWKKEINTSVLGGVVIEYGDTVLDLSLAARLDSLVETINK